jgi:hypothetical protein
MQIVTSKEGNEGAVNLTHQDSGRGLAIGSIKSKLQQTCVSNLRRTQLQRYLTLVGHALQAVHTSTTDDADLDARELLLSHGGWTKQNKKKNRTKTVCFSLKAHSQRKYVMTRP